MGRDSGRRVSQPERVRPLVQLARLIHDEGVGYDRKIYIYIDY